MTTLQSTRMPLRAALYSRISPDAQAVNGLSVPDERHRLRDHCAAMGWPVVAEFTDTQGGIGRNRPGFRAMMDAALDGAPLFDVIVVHSFRRFSRDEIESELSIRSLKKRGIEVVSITQQFDDSAVGEMVQRIIELFDEQDAKERRKNVARAMEANARQGFFNGGIAPYGYRSVEVEKRGNTSKKKLEPREDEAKTIRLIFYLYLRGDRTTGPLGVKKIVEWLNDRGYRTRRGAQWGIGPVHHLLTDPVYKGDYRQNSTTANEQLRVPVPAIVSNGVFDAVQRRIASGSPRSRRSHSGRP